MSTLFKGVYYFLAIPVDEHTIQGSIVIKGAYYLRKYGKSVEKIIDYITTFWQYLDSWQNVCTEASKATNSEREQKGE